MEQSTARWHLARKLALLYALNIADWLCTITLLRTGGFYEANPLMSPVIQSIPIGFLLKCILPAALLLLVWYLCSKLGGRELVMVDVFLSFVIVIYTAICTIHIIDFIMWHIGFDNVL